MKVSAALQLLTTVMSGAGSKADDWTAPRPQHVQQQAGDFVPRADLDLGACLDVETLDELSQQNNMYTDPDTHRADTDAWVDSVIDMTSSGELMSSGDHAGIVPSSNAEESSRGIPLAGSLDFFIDNLTATDNATFITLDNALTSASTDTSLLNSSTQDLAPFASVGCFTTPATQTDPTTSTSTSTIDLTALEQFMTMDVDVVSTGGQSLEESGSFTASTSSSSNNIPNSLWNLDLTLLPDDGAAAAVPSSFSAASSSSGVVSHQDIKNSLKNRLHSRGSVQSVSQDGDLTTCSTRSLSSSTSSLTQSFEEEDPDDPQKILEKREKNRVAAQKCRNKKRDKAENLQKVTVPSPDDFG